MEGYQKLAVFLAVLLFSVGTMSVAIDILGDITDLEFQTGTRPMESTKAGSDQVELAEDKGQPVEVEAAQAQAERALFEIAYPTGTRYLRWGVGGNYDDGTWEPYESTGWTPYEGWELTPESAGASHAYPRYFTVRPFSNLTGYMPGTLHMVRIGPTGPLEYHRNLELFATSEPINWAYGIEHLVVEHSEASLRAADITPDDEHLQVPEYMENRLENLAEDIVEGYNSPYEQLSALEAYLRATYVYDKNYTRAENGTDPIEWFLFEERVGTCTQFNSAFALLARSIGLPVRPVVGFSIKPDANYQLVLGRDAHLWAEAHFEGLGWVTFDATPPREEEVPPEVMIHPTVTNITYNDPTALKGGKFRVGGTVTLLNGTEVDGLTVEIFLTLKKNETDAPCGTGIVRRGVFAIDCDAVPELAVGDYNLIAHTLPGGIYGESWSDPPIKIMAETESSIMAPQTAYVGSSVRINGVLLDKSNGEPVPNATLTVHVGNETLTLLTDSTGGVSLAHAFEEEGNHTVLVEMGGSDYYLGSNSSFGIAVSIPPAPKPSIFMIITTFPYNVIVFAAVTVIVGAVLVMTQRKERADETRPEAEEPFDDEIPLQYQDYKEGVVRLFNWFYARSRWMYDGIEDSMTPREFQAAVEGNIPDRGTPALEYFVTAFEIADYSASKPSQEMYEKSLGAVTLLKELMDHGE